MSNKDYFLNKMRASVGTQDPTLFFKDMVEVFSLLFDKLDSVENTLKKVKLNSAMAIQWDPAIASKMIVDEIEFLRKEGNLLGTNMYDIEIKHLKEAYMGTQQVASYSNFVHFWKEELGYHPFLEDRK